MPEQEPIRLAQPRMQRHYCRACGEQFDPLKQFDPSPHARVLIHLMEKHRTVFDSLMMAGCSRQCLYRAQPEELERDERMYGEQVHPAHNPTALEDYRKLFPEDME